jgi:hypothetical protein
MSIWDQVGTRDLNQARRPRSQRYDKNNDVGKEVSRTRPVARPKSRLIWGRRLGRRTAMEGISGEETGKEGETAGDFLCTITKHQFSKI